MKLLSKILPLTIVLLLVSCVKDVDFGQANQFEITPKLALSLFPFSFNQTSLVERVPNVGLSFTDTVEFTAFENLKNKEYLERVDVEIEINNPFNRDFVLNVTFFDSNAQQTYTYKTLNVSANSTLKDVETIVIANHPNLPNSTRASIRLEMLPGTGGTGIDQTVPLTLTFKSGGIFHFRIR